MDGSSKKRVITDWTASNRNGRHGNGRHLIGSRFDDAPPPSLPVFTQHSSAFVRVEIVLASFT